MGAHIEVKSARVCYGGVNKGSWWNVAGFSTLKVVVINPDNLLIV